MQPQKIIRRKERKIIRRQNQATNRMSHLSFAKTSIRIALFSSIFVLAVVIVVSVFSPFLKVKEINIEGIELTPRHQIQEITPQMGKWMPTLKTKHVASIINELPTVKSVQIAREWPDTVRIIVSELEPRIVWEQAGENYLISETGIVLQALELTKVSLPKVIGTSKFSLKPGDKVNVEAVKTALQIPNLILDSLDTEVTEISNLPGVGIRIKTSDGKYLLIQNAKNLELQIQVWKQIITQAKIKEIEYTEVDLRFQNHPVLRNIQNNRETN